MKYPNSSRFLTLIALSVATTYVVAQNNEEEITEAFSITADIITTGTPTSSPVTPLTLTDAPVIAATGLLPSFFPTKEMENKDGQVIFSFSPKKDEKTGEEEVEEEDKKKKNNDGEEDDDKKKNKKDNDVVDKKKEENDDSDVVDKKDEKNKKKDKKEKDDVEEKDKKEKDTGDDLDILSPADTQPLKPITEAQIVIAIDDEVTLTPPLGAEIFIPVLENDSGTSLSVTQLISQATFGICGISLDLTEVVYQTTSDFVDGIDSCDYEVCENGGINCATATVTIIVSNPTMPPVTNDDVPTYPPTGGILTTPAPLPTFAFPTLSSPGDAAKTVAPTTSIGDVPTYPPTGSSTTVGSEPTGGTFKTSAPTSVIVITTPFPTEALSSVYVPPNVPPDYAYDKDDVVPELRGTNKTIAPTPDADRPTPTGYYVPPPTHKDDDGYYVPPPAPKDDDGYYVPPPTPKDDDGYYVPPPAPTEDDDYHVSPEGDDDEYEYPAKHHSVDDGEEYHKPNKEPSSHRWKKPHHEEYKKKPWWAHDSHEHEYYAGKGSKSGKSGKGGKRGGYTKGGKTKSSKGGDYYSKGGKYGGSGKAGKGSSGSSSRGGSWWWADRY
jgi:hypothetical protein